MEDGLLLCCRTLASLWDGGRCSIACCCCSSSSPFGGEKAVLIVITIRTSRILPAAASPAAAALDPPWPCRVSLEWLAVFLLGLGDGTVPVLIASSCDRQHTAAC